MRNPPVSEPSDELREIYHLLKIGVAHEKVNDGNVFHLIDLAVRYGDKHIEALLREWQSPCSDGSEGVPSVIQPTKGFNKENVKR
ncbi:MAG TPA: hypothetical protein VJM53_07115 [Burkholderiales bacterium]|jgi:hypothetical protein|nr:hypothetical protein [Burkholderiales bacterium]